MNYNEIEIHTLICKRDILLAINNFKSLCKFEEFAQMPIFFHDDGSLSQSDVELLLSSIKNVTFIDRKWADVEIKKYIKNHPFCNTYRCVDKHIHLWHKIKSFDYFFFSKTKKVLGMDTDLLFMRRPEAVMEYIKSNTPFYFPDLQSAYCFNEPKSEIPVLEKVNTGLIYIPGPEYYDLDAIEFALSNLLRNGVNYFPSWIEQSAFAHMFLKNGKYKVLNDQKYRIPYFQSVNIEDVECLHFVSYPAVRETYQHYTDYLKFDRGTVVYQNNFLVDFEDKKIPLTISVSKSDNMYIFNYRWELDKSGQNALDHFFKIETDDGEITIHKFQSEKTGFFFVNGKHKTVSLHHTYDWYGKNNWLLKDTILL